MKSLKDVLLEYSAIPNSPPFDQELLEQEGLGSNREGLFDQLNSYFAGDHKELIFGAESPSIQSKKMCGYSFKSSDLIYRCSDCGIDDSCCLCTRPLVNIRQVLYAFTRQITRAIMC